MDFLAGIARELADLETYERWQTDRTSVPRPSASSSIALTSFRTELRHAGAMTAVNASIANRLVASDVPGPELGALAALAPPHPAAVAQLVDRLSGLPGNSRLSQASLELLWQVRSASQISLMLTAESTCPSAVGIGSAEAVADAWRRSCAAWLRMHPLVEAMLPEPSPAEAASDARLLDMLRQAAEGRSPCIDRHGKLSVPGIADRRTSARYERSEAVSIVIGAERHCARLVDVSAKGACVSTPVEFTVGSAVTLLSATGSGLGARIVWCRGSRLGLAFDAPLNEEHPWLNH